MSGDVFPIEERDFLTSVMLVWSGVREAICKVFPPLPIGGIGEVKGNLHHGGGGFCVAARADLFSMKILVIKHHGLLYFFDMMFVLGCKQLFFFFAILFFQLDFGLGRMYCFSLPAWHAQKSPRSFQNQCSQDEDHDFSFGQRLISDNDLKKLRINQWM